MEGSHKEPSKVHTTGCVKLNTDFEKPTVKKKKKKTKQLQCSEGFELFVLRQLYHCPTDGRLEFGRQLPLRSPEPKRFSESTLTPPRLFCVFADCDRKLHPANYGRGYGWLAGRGAR